MNPFGDGSNGALNVLSGTANLPLNTKHQFTTVNIAAGATLTTDSTTGAVLYILATESIIVDGAINVSNKVIAGNNTWSWTVDGVTYSSPGVADGGYGGWFTDNTQPVQANGFGAGGTGAGGYTEMTGGEAGNGSSVAGIGGARVSTSRSGSSFSVTVKGNSGGGSAGGSGGTYVKFSRASGTVTGTVSVVSGRGANAYGLNGEDAVSGSVNASGSGSGSYSYNWIAGGGGGGGGIAGKSGVHVVLISPIVTINGTVITSGTNGGNGGYGGRNRTWQGLQSTRGAEGGGGGGGNGGDLIIRYNSSYTNGTYDFSGGARGLKGQYPGGSIGNAWSGNPGISGNVDTLAITPVPNFTSPTTAFRSSPITFVNTTSGGVTYLWTFGDGTTSTAENPTKTYAANGIYTVSLKATNTAGNATETKTNYITVTTKAYNLSLESGATGGGIGTPTKEIARVATISGGRAYGQVYVKTVFQELPQKDYEARIFDEDWNYISTWQGEVKEFGYSQRINENASELPVELARSPDNRVVKLDPLRDTNGDIIIDSNGDQILLQTETANSVGLGTDVRENLNVEIYAFYGGYDALQDENGDDILDHNGEAILSQFGAPNGKRVYSGYIADYELLYGTTKGVNVIVVPHATEMKDYIFKDNLGKETVKYLNTDPIIMARDAMANYRAQGGYIDYSVATMPLSGSATDYDFKLQTPREAVDKSVDLLPSGYYHFVDPGENLQYLLPRATTAHHTFYYEKHITDMRLRKTITQLKNKVYFIGGEYDPVGHPGEDLFLYEEDTDSINALRPGLERISDSRVKKITSAQILAQREIAEYKTARWRTTVVIPDTSYDIELIKLGQMVGFRNFGSETDNLLLQIVGITRTKHTITLELDSTLPTEAKRLEELKKGILNEQIRNIGESAV